MPLLLRAPGERQAVSGCPPGWTCASSGIGKASPTGIEVAPSQGATAGSAKTSEIRILFAFDPHSDAVLLVAGDKAGNWRRWYAEAIPLAEQRYELWIKESQS